MILECNIWCYDRKLDDLGVETNMWLPMAIDLRKVIAVKVNSYDDNEFVPPGSATLYIEGDSFVTDLTYGKALELFKKTNSNTPQFI